MTDEKKPRLFLSWPESGEPASLVAEDLKDLDLAHGVLDELRELLTGDWEDGEKIVIFRKDMTDAEVAAIPEL